ncbi:MAG: hypothetical protein C0599_08965 [Salinivirgaceae bacterium]|nr:MAG: hypothetical protein C0599_08965 [Salinivirgaceae bacterium]
MRRLLAYFFQGLIATAPVVLTIYLIYVSFVYVDGLLPFEIPGLGLLVIVISITLIGFVVNFAIRTPLYHYVQKLLDRLPLFKVIVTSIKDLLSAFVGKEKKFEHPVRVLLDDKNRIERLGFLTQKSLDFIGIEEGRVAVYFPSSYGILGELYIVPADRVTPMDAKAAEMMKFIISGGVSKAIISNEE